MSAVSLEYQASTPVVINHDLNLAVGRNSPLGATVVSDGVNFSIFSRNASGVELLLFDQADDARATRVIQINAATNRTLDYWHVFVPGIRTGQLYGYRMHGPFDLERGMRFDPDKLLLDPYTRGVAVPKQYNRTIATIPGDNVASAMKSVVLDSNAYDWEGDSPLHRPASRSIIYEMHVGGFTRHPNSGVPRENAALSPASLKRSPICENSG